MVKKTCAELVQKAGTTPRDARHAEANEVSFLLRDRLGMYNREDLYAAKRFGSAGAVYGSNYVYCYFYCSPGLCGYLLYRQRQH